MAQTDVSEFISALQKDELVTLLVSEDENPYKIQRDLLIKASKWFDKALNEVDSSKSEEVVLRFPDTHSQVIEFFLYYLLRGTLPLNATKDDKDQLLAVRIWTFGDKHLLHELQNKAMTYLFNHFGSKFPDVYPAIETVREALQTSASDSVMRKFMMLRCVLPGLRRRVDGGGPYRPNPPGYEVAEIMALGDMIGIMKDFAEEVAKGLPSCEGCPYSLQKFLVSEEEQTG